MGWLILDQYSHSIDDCERTLFGLLLRGITMRAASKTIQTENGFKLKEISFFDENGEVVKVRYDVTDADDNVLGHFSSIDKAQAYLSTLNMVSSPSPFNM